MNSHRRIARTRVGDHHLTCGFISLLSVISVLSFVCCICGRFKSAEKVAQMEDEGSPADLTKAEGRLEIYKQPNIPTTNASTYHHSRTDTISVDRFGREHEIMMLLEHGIDVADRKCQMA